MNTRTLFSIIAATMLCCNAFTVKAEDTEPPTLGEKFVLPQYINSNEIYNMEYHLFMIERATDNETPKDKLQYNFLVSGQNAGHFWVDKVDTLPDYLYYYVYLEAEKVYTVFVQVSDEAGNMTTYWPVNVHTPCIPPRPGNGILTVMAIDDHSISLQWEKGSDDITPQNELRYVINIEKKIEEHHWEVVKSDTIYNPDELETMTYTADFDGLGSNTNYNIGVAVLDAGYEIPEYFINEKGCSSSYGIQSFTTPDFATSPTAVAETQNALPQPAGYYNLLGKKLDKAPESGIYIIKYDNGTTAKVVK